MTRGFPEGLYVEGKKYLCKLSLDENRPYYKKIRRHMTLKKVDVAFTFSVSWGLESFNGTVISRTKKRYCLFPKSAIIKEKQKSNRIWNNQPCAMS